LKDDRGCTKYIWDLEEPCDGVFFEVCDIVLVICKALEDIFEGVDFERGEAFTSELLGLEEC
jgi:hypothetical protein